MSDDERTTGDMASGEMAPRDGRLHDLHDEAGDLATLDVFDIAEMTRLHEALQRLDQGAPAGLDPREDPALTGMVGAVGLLRDTLADASDTRSFHSFHQRSRSALLHTLEAEQPVPLRERIRLVVAAAAGIAAVFIGISAIGAPMLQDRTGDPAAGLTVAATNLTARTSEDQLRALSQSVQALQERARSGAPVPVGMLHEVTESAARLAHAIEREPETVSPEMVRAFAQQASDVRAVLNEVRPEPGAEGAAVAAQRAAEDGQVVATRYLDGAAPEATAEPEATPAPTPEATSTATATPEATPEPTSEATATAPATD